MLFINKYKSLFPLIIISVLIVQTVIRGLFFQFELEGELYNYTLKPRHYLALLATVLCAISYFKFRSYYKYFIIGTLLLGLFNLILFSLTILTFGIEISAVKIGIEPTIFLIALVSFLLNRKASSKLALDLFGKQHEEREQLNELSRVTNINKFKLKFKEYAPEKLDSIIADDRYTSDAIEAAKQLLSEGSK